MKKILLGTTLFFGLTAGSAFAAEFTVYKSPWCGCCTAWGEHLEAAGHKVTNHKIEDMDAIKQMAGIPEHLQSCHTAKVEGYLIEGHVPAEDIDRLLKEKPDAKGLTAPGMPVGSPGMEGGAPETYEVLLMKNDGTTEVFARH